MSQNMNLSGKTENSIGSQAVLGTHGKPYIPSSGGEPKKPFGEVLSSGKRLLREGSELTRIPAMKAGNDALNKISGDFYGNRQLGPFIDAAFSATKDKSAEFSRQLAAYHVQENKGPASDSGYEHGQRQGR